MRVEKIMTKNPVTVDITDSVAKTARQMRDKGVGSVVILQDGKVRGIVTDRMLATNVLAEDRDMETAVGDIMLEHPAVLSPDDNIFHAVDVMRSANVARRIPVVNNYNELVGIVSVSDIAVVAQDLIGAVLLEETHHALNETHVLTGAKRIVKEMRRPTKDLPFDQETHPTTEATAEGLPTKRGNVPQTRRGR
jgi:CBS domain-containing protein